MGRSGLRPIREQWWVPLQYESPVALWRHIVLLESSPEPEPRATELPETARIAVYSPGHLGDLLHTIPLLKALRGAFPRSHLEWIVGPWGHALARRYDFIDRVTLFSPAWGHYRRGHRGPGLWSQRRWGRSCATVDLFVSTSPADLATLFVGRSLRPRVWCGFEPAFALYPVAARSYLRPMQRDAPHAEDLLQLAAPLGVTGTATLEYTVRPDERAAAARLRDAAGIRGPYCVLAPGAGWPGKQWPIERWAEVADCLAQKGWAVVVVGANSETALGDAVRRHARHPVTDMTGKTDLATLAALIAEARLWLGSDSGGLHLAAAVGTPTVSLFGPTSPAKWAPSGPQHVALRAVEGCPVCHPWHPRARCAHNGACMKAITADEVVAAASELLSK